MIKEYKETNTICSECNNVFTFYRKKGRLRKSGHKKHIYCIKCKKITIHIEQGSE